MGFCILSSTVVARGTPEPWVDLLRKYDPRWAALWNVSGMALRQLPLADGNPPTVHNRRGPIDADTVRLCWDQTAGSFSSD
jgi:hypothetical protein